ncbi:MAG: histidine kinase [Nakamurella multipartita]
MSVDPLAPDATRPHPGTSLRDALLAVGTLMGALVFVELAVPSLSTVTAASVLDAVAVTAFTVTGLIAWRRRPHNRTGRLMVATAAALLVGGMNDDAVPALRVLGELAESLPLALLIHLLLAYPSGRLVGRAARVTAGAGYVIALVLQYPQRVIPPAASSVLWTVQAGLGLIVLISAFVLVSRRLAGSPPVLRRQLTPFIGAGCVMLAIVVGTLFVLHADPAPAVADLATLVQVAAVAILPAAFVVGLLAGAFGRAGELEELAHGIAQASADPTRLDELVVRALGDRSARVLWTAGPALVDSGGAVRDPVDGPDRGWWPIGPAGAPVGGLSYDRSLIADTGLMATTSGPLALAIDNRRLVVDLRAAVRDLDAAVEQVRESRRRIVVAADAERRRIARDLHDGPQQRIVLLGIEAQRIGRRAGDADFVAPLAETISEQLRHLLDDLRDLVHGIMPATLAERGLPAGVAALTERVPIPVALHVDPTIGRMPAEVESTGYFVVAEGLTNAVKHAGAQAISVDVAVRGDRLAITVSDDGRGPGEHPTPGFGLRGLQDRVAALGGTVTLAPGPARGSILRAEFACA